MWTACLLMASALAADVTDAGPGRVEAPEPILELAERDIRETRRATTALAMAAVAPGLVFTGAQALGPLAQAELTGNAVGAGSLVILGFGGMLVLPAWAHSHAARSRRLLEEQGLTVQRTLPWIVTAGLSLAAPVAMLTTADPRATSSAAAGRLILSIGLYGGAMGIVAWQQHSNHQARKQAGWLALCPVTSEGAPGLALAATW